MSLCRASLAVASLAVGQAWPFVAQASTAQDSGPVVFGDEVFDVTGAGVLDLGALDAVLMPFRRAFDQGSERLGVEVTIDAAGIVQDCRFDPDDNLAPAGKALCAEALRTGRFRQFRILALEYVRATYRLSIRSQSGRPIKGEAAFRMSSAYPYEGRPITFGKYTIPPEGERLTLADLEYRSMAYPPDALQNAIAAEVVVAVTFDAQGRVAKCRPIRSSNTARIAYDTCIQAQRGFTLRSPPDERPYVWLTQWRLAE